MEQEEQQTPAPGTKAALERELAAALAELEVARGQLAEARARAGGASPARITFPGRPDFRGGTKLSEGERQDLEMNGVATDPVTGQTLLASDFDVEVKTSAGVERLAKAEEARASAGDGGDAKEGVDFVFPSIAPGVLAPDAPVRGAVVDTAVQG